jgi:hypothetical protein
VPTTVGRASWIPAQSRIGSLLVQGLPEDIDLNLRCAEKILTAEAGRRSIRREVCVLIQDLQYRPGRVARSTHPAAFMRADYRLTRSGALVRVAE